MRILVTGSNGFLGAALCRKLVERGDEVRGLVRRTSDLSLLEGIPVEQVTGSLEDTASLDRAVSGVELVYHVAAAVTDWGSYAYFHRINVEGTQNILQAAARAGVRRFVHVSSVAVHSFSGGRDMNENAPLFPTPFPYCQTKREAEALVMEAHRKGEVEAAVVRPGDIYGPGDRVGLLKMAPLLEKGLMAIIKRGRSLGAFAYVENLADGIVLAGIRPEAAGQAYILTDGIKLTWREYFQKLTQALDLPPVRISLPPWMAYGVAAFLEGIFRVFRVKARPPVTRYLVAHLRKDFHFGIEKARLELGYHPAIGVDEAIRRTAQWYKSVVRKD
jgi:nucleoside-diphosphate-sugar epimerase